MELIELALTCSYIIGLTISNSYEIIKIAFILLFNAETMTSENLCKTF